MQKAEIFRDGETVKKEAETFSAASPAVSKNSGASESNRSGKEYSEVLFVWNYTEWGGAQIYFLGIMREALKKYGVTAVMPSATKGKILDYLERENISCSFFEGRIDGGKAPSFARKLKRRINDWSCNWRLMRHLSKLDISDKIIHIDAAPWNAFALLYLLALKTHVFHTQHISQPNAPTLRNRLTRLKFKLLCRLPKFHLLASNDDMKKSLRWYVGDEHFQQIPLAYTGVNTVEIKTALSFQLDRQALLAKYDLPDDKLFVFALGNIIERKGFRVFLDAARGVFAGNKFENAGNDISPVFFVWLGDGDKRGDMESLINESDLKEHVKIIRPAEIGDSRQDLLQLLRLADIFAHPSFAEGLPGALLEAMALGKPVVASRVNAIPEAVIEGETGFLIEAGDSEKLAESIVKLAQNKKLRAQIGLRGQRKVLDNFTEERCAEVTLDFYGKCLSKEKN